eukprot:TRINITY_DN7955_c0_g1_i1.p1 TRINITY_DN7955_c0_g1~~TRINITY_DN7955_c0_g1_i1.p1  ORF type:complete len:114 (-),score=18.57 TRINITY_DN7955_c0_g1_i1:44-385(-)
MEENLSPTRKKLLKKIDPECRKIFLDMVSCQDRSIGSSFTSACASEEWAFEQCKKRAWKTKQQKRRENMKSRWTPQPEADIDSEEFEQFMKGFDEKKLPNRPTFDSKLPNQRT